MTKGVRSKNGYLAAAAGHAVDISRFLKAVLEEEIDDLEDLPYENLDAILVHPKHKKIIQFEAKGSFEMEGDTFTFGVAADLMKGAMEAGASAEEAVRIACKLMPGSCGGPVWVLK